MEQRQSGIVSTVVQILAIGDANVELVFSPLSSLPRFGREVIVPRIFLHAAGSATNFALCAAHLGVKTGFAGRLAVDKFGEVVLKALREEHKDTIERTRARLKEQQATRRPICEQLRTGPKTIPEIAEAIGLPSHKVLWHVTAMKKYDLVVEVGQSGEYYLYEMAEEAES